jgi:hypothetical protein
VIGNAVHVMRIATGEIEENSPAQQGKEYARKGGLKGGHARAAKLTDEQRSEIARAARRASIFKLMDVSRHKSVDTLRGYVRDADAFRDHAGAGLL